jgi:hypothetical protein
VTWDAIALNGTLAPGQYFLINITGGTDPEADVSGSFPLGVLLNSKGSIALVRTSVPLTVVSPSIADIPDLFGWGQGSSADGTPFPQQPTGFLLFGPQSALRLGGGCTETHDNASDFQLATPAPRNTHSPLSLCATTPIIQGNGV